MAKMDSLTHLGLLARHPKPGHGKTRLAQSLGIEATADLYEAFVLDCMTGRTNLADQFTVIGTPENSEAKEWFQQHRPKDADFRWQPEGDFNQRIADFFQSNNGRCVLLGTDSPDLPDRIIQQAFDRLEFTDVVFAPATDGGMVLIGCRRWVGGLFDSVPWSSASTLQDAQAAVIKNGLKYELLTGWYDIDEMKDLQMFVALQRGELPVDWHLPPEKPRCCVQSVAAIQRWQRLL